MKYESLTNNNSTISNRVHKLVKRTIRERKIHKRLRC